MAALHGRRVSVFSRLLGLCGALYPSASLPMRSHPRSTSRRFLDAVCASENADYVRTWGLTPRGTRTIDEIRSLTLSSAAPFSHRPLGGRHAAVIPALPDEQDSPSPGSGGNGNGYFEHPEPEPMPIPIAVPASSGPAQAVLGRHGELQIIQVEKEDPSLRPRHAPPQLNNAPMKPITFHQEYPNVPPEHRGRRGSRNHNSNHAPPPPPTYDDYSANGMQVDSHSPAHSRTASRSPVLHRERVDRDRDGGYYDHHSHLPPPALPHSRSQGSLPSPHQRSAYESHAPVPNGGEATYRERERERADRSPPPPPVPATFASIMNAYPAPPMSSPPGGDGAGGDYTNGNGGSRRNGHASHASYSPVAER